MDEVKAHCFRKSAKPGHGKCEKWVEDDVTNTLNTFEFHSEVRTPQVVCFKPGIAKREGSTSRFVKNKSVTLRANMGDNQPAVCYAIDSHPEDSRFKIDNCGSVPTLTVKIIAKGSADGPLVLIKSNESICDRKPSE